MPESELLYWAFTRSLAVVLVALMCLFIVFKCRDAIEKRQKRKQNEPKD